MDASDSEANIQETNIEDFENTPPKTSYQSTDIDNKNSEMLGSNKKTLSYDLLESVTIY